MNLVQSQSPNLHKLTSMQIKWSIQKRTTSFLVQLNAVGDDVEDTLTPPYATIQEEFADVFQPLPSGLPSKWEMTHIIILEQDEEPHAS